MLSVRKTKRETDLTHQTVYTSLEEFPNVLFQLKHRRRIRTANSLERVNREIRRRTSVAGVFPNGTSSQRLISALLMEISEEWQSGKRLRDSKSRECLRTGITSDPILQKKGCII
ncbi:MAG: transposase [Chloroflexota bacterium]